MNYVVLLDTSGSMGGKLEEQPKMDAVKKSLQQLAKRLSAKYGGFPVAHLRT
jgi:Ca-activated chloride channel family protein